MKFNLVPLQCTQYMWIEMNTYASKQGLNLFTLTLGGLNVAEPPKKSGPCTSIIVSIDLSQRTQVLNNLTGLSGVLGKPESSTNLFRTGSQSQTLQITIVYSNIYIRVKYSGSLKITQFTNQLFQTYKTISVIQPQQRDNITLTLFIIQTSALSKGHSSFLIVIDFKHRHAAGTKTSLRMRLTCNKG